jgi:hypothetical protein
MYVRQVQVFNIIEKVQSINTLVWFPGLLLKLSAYNFMGAFVLGQVFKKVKVAKFSIIISIVAFAVCIIPQVDTTRTTDYLISDKLMPYIIFAIIVVVPLILLGVYALNKKNTDKKVEAMLAEENAPQQNNEHQEKEKEVAPAQLKQEDGSQYTG